LLNRGAGLSERVAVVQADACRLPFPPEQFDAAITQHVAMSIEDKGAFYSGIHAALRPGGLLGLYDVIATGAGALEFPLPWARRPEDSFVLDAAGLRAALVRAGFIVRDWVDRTQDAQAWFAGQAAARAAGAPEPALSLSLVMGPGFASMAANLARNLAQGRVRLVQVIAQRPR
jgi:SAM-dependent methyltransferase